MTRHKSKETPERLRDYLRSGAVKAGDRLPGERELAETLGIGRTALRPALEELEELGFLRRQPQQGTYLVEVPPPAASGASILFVAPFRGSDAAGAASEMGWLYRVATSFERTAKPSGAEIALYDQSPVASDPCSIKQIAHEAIDRGFSAAVLVHPRGTREKIACALALLHDHDVHPVIVSARTYAGLASQVYFDSGWGAYIATRHLLTRGHRRIGYAGAPSGYEWDRERVAGYRQALAVAEIDENSDWEWHPSDGERPVTMDDGAFAFNQWRNLPAAVRPTALIAANDLIALGILEAARSAGVSVPHDLSIVGFDNDPEALLAGLTTIERPTEILGESIAHTTLERLAAGPRAATVTLRLRPILIERATVGAIATYLDTHD